MNTKVFGPTDMPLEDKIKLLNSKLPTSNENLFDKFIQCFQPYIFDVVEDGKEYGKNFWTTEKIFGSSPDNIINKGKIHGFYLHVKKGFIKIFNHDIHDVALISNGSFIYKSLLTSGHEGQVYIPLEPSINENGDVISYNYPKYFDSKIYDLPNIVDVNEHATIVILDIYNFILSYLAGYDYLTILTYYHRKENKLVPCTNIVTYDIPFCDDIKEMVRSKRYGWIQVIDTNGSPICLFPLITLTMYFHASQISCGVPMHFQTFFDYQLKVDKFGIIRKNGVRLNELKINDDFDRRDANKYHTQLKNLCYLSEASKSSDSLILNSISECNAKTLSLSNALGGKYYDDVGETNDEIVGLAQNPITLNDDPKFRIVVNGSESNFFSSISNEPIIGLPSSRPLVHRLTSTDYLPRIPDAAKRKLNYIIFHYIPLIFLLI